MSKIVKCDFCKKEIKRLSSYYTFEMGYSNYTDTKNIDVCKSCYKKFIRSVQVAEAFEEDKDAASN